ncbi:MAG: hypothetical protein R2710_13450 [Acidimicrobiales bacterium]
MVDPVPGVLVEMALGEGPARAISALTAPTDATGIARFGAVCETAGSAPASFVVAPTLDEVTHSAALLECVVPPPPPDDLEDGLADDGSGSADGRAGIDG